MVFCFALRCNPRNGSDCCPGEAKVARCGHRCRENIHPISDDLRKIPGDEWVATSKEAEHKTQSAYPPRLCGQEHLLSPREKCESRLRPPSQRGRVALVSVCNCLKRAMRQLAVNDTPRLAHACWRGARRLSRC